MSELRVDQYAKLLVETCIDVQPGWQVLVVWECQTTPARREALRARLLAFLTRD